MLELMSESDGDVIAVRARGVLTKDDYQDVLIPHLESALEAVDRVRVLFLMDETFRGWDARAAWLNTRLDLRHRRHFNRVAIVGAPTWEEWCVKLVNLLIAGKLKTFTRDELSNAWTWLRRAHRSQHTEPAQHGNHGRRATQPHASAAATPIPVHHR